MSLLKQWTDAHLLATGLVVAFHIIPKAIRLVHDTTGNPIDRSERKVRLSSKRTRLIPRLSWVKIDWKVMSVFHIDVVDCRLLAGTRDVEKQILVVRRQSSDFDDSNCRSICFLPIEWSSGCSHETTQRRQTLQRIFVSIWFPRTIQYDRSLYQSSTESMYSFGGFPTWLGHTQSIVLSFAQVSSYSNVTRSTVQWVFLFVEERFQMIVVSANRRCGWCSTCLFIGGNQSTNTVLVHCHAQW